MLNRLAQKLEFVGNIRVELLLLDFVHHLFVIPIGLIICVAGYKTPRDIERVHMAEEALEVLAPEI